MKDAKSYLKCNSFYRHPHFLQELKNVVDKVNKMFIRRKRSKTALTYLSTNTIHIAKIKCGNTSWKNKSNCKHQYEKHKTCQMECQIDSTCDMAKNNLYYRLGLLQLGQWKYIDINSGFSSEHDNFDYYTAKALVNEAQVEGLYKDQFYRDGTSKCELIAIRRLE